MFYEDQFVTFLALRVSSAPQVRWRGASLWKGLSSVTSCLELHQEHILTFLEGLLNHGFLLEVDGSLPPIFAKSATIGNIKIIISHHFYIFE